MDLSELLSILNKIHKPGGENLTDDECIDLVARIHQGVNAGITVDGGFIAYAIDAFLDLCERDAMGFYSAEKTIYIARTATGCGDPECEACGVKRTTH